MTNDVLKVIPTVMSIDLLNSNIKKSKKKKIVKQGIDNIIGSTIISETSNFLQ